MTKDRQSVRPDITGQCTLSPDEALDLAVQLHQAGRLSEAKGIYEAVLTANPAHASALHFLGVLYHQRAESDRAVGLLRDALAIRPDYADAYNNLGNVLNEKGDHRGAAEAYRAVIRLEPRNAAAWNNLGVALKTQHLLADALAALRRSVQIAPDIVDAHFNVGNMLEAMGRRHEAASAYQRAIALAPEHADAHFRLGKVLASIGKPDEALSEYHRAAELDTGHAGAECNIGHALQRKGLFADAVAAYDRALGIDGTSQQAMEGKARALCREGHLQRAAAVVREWIRLAPENPVPRHLLAAITGEDVPERAADLYIKRVFDQFAETFEEHLERLAYRAPRLIAAAIAARLRPEGSLAVLDAGCGTGLCGPLLRPFASRLIGVDLSSGMIERARGREIYDDVVEAELTHWLLMQPPESYDMVACADTLCYFGDLHQVLGGMRHVLRRGGLLVFTVESAEASAATTAGFRIHPHGRYSHTGAHVAAAIAASGIDLLQMEGQILRLEGGTPVNGLVITGLRD
jgi:predicted TPR repeat methyltransferase